MQKTPKRHRLGGAYDIIEFIRPDNLWPYPYSIEQMFGVLQYAVRTGSEYYAKTRWGRDGVMEILNGDGLNQSLNVITVESIQHLRDIIRRAVLGRPNDAVAEWRDAHGFTPASRTEINFRHWKPFSGTPHAGLGSEIDIQQALAEYFNTGSGKTRLRVTLNTTHPKAVWIRGLKIDVLGDRFRFRLDYGYEGSVWHQLLARTRKGESFLDTFQRARATLQGMITGGAGTLAAFSKDPPDDDHPLIYAYIDNQLIKMTFPSQVGNVFVLYYLKTEKTKSPRHAIVAPNGKPIGFMPSLGVMASEQQIARKVDEIGDWSCPTPHLFRKGRAIIAAACRAEAANRTARKK